MKLESAGGGSYGGTSIGRASPSAGSTAGTVAGGVDTIVIPVGRIQSCPPGYYGTKQTGRPLICHRIVSAAPVKAPAPVAASAPIITTTISPTFQQAFTPQFSPVMQQTQDSPGAVQAAAPQQITTAPQYASTAPTQPAPGYVTPAPAYSEPIPPPSAPSIPAANYAMAPLPPTQGATPAMDVPAQLKPDIMRYAPYALIALALIGGAVIMTRKRKRPS